MKLTREGRTIYRDGKPFVSIHRSEWPPCPENSYTTSAHAFSPEEADLFAKYSVLAPELAEALRRNIDMALEALSDVSSPARSLQVRSDTLRAIAKNNRALLARLEPPQHTRRGHDSRTCPACDES